MKKISNAILCALVCGVSLLQAAELSLTKDKENVVSSRISGSWTVDRALSLKLTGVEESTGGENPIGNVTFESDTEVIDGLPEQYKDKFEELGTRVFMCGWMSFGKQKCPFFVVERSGNPHILFFLEKDGEVYGNGESFNVMMAVAKEPKNDLLFIGGDF